MSLRYLAKLALQFLQVAHTKCIWVGQAFLHPIILAGGDRPNESNAPSLCDCGPNLMPGAAVEISLNHDGHEAHGGHQLVALRKVSTMNLGTRLKLRNDEAVCLDLLF